MLHVYCPINHSIICSCHYGWHFAFLSIGNWNEQYWHTYTELQILALSKLCQIRSATVDGPWEAALYAAQFQRFSLCWVLMMARAAPQLPATLPATPVNRRLWGYHKDLRITIKDFLGKCQVHPWHELTIAIWAALHVIIVTSWATCIKAFWHQRS